MDLLHWVLFGVLPAVAAVLLGVGVGGPRWLGPAVAVAICVPFGMAAGWPDWPWRLDPQHGAAGPWLWWCLLGAGIVGAAYDLRLLPKALLFCFEVALVALLPWLLSASLRRGFSFEQCVLWLGLGWALLAAVWWTLRTAAKLRPGMAVPLAGAIALAGDALLLRARGAAPMWELAGVGAVALGVAVATTAWRRPFVCGTGGTLAVTIAHLGILWWGRSAGELAAAPFVLAAAAPLGLAVAATKAFADGRGAGLVVGVALVAAAAATAVGMA